MERTPLSETTDAGTKDGSGAADNDQPFQFGRRPRAVAPWPFTERQYAHLLMMRGRVLDTPDPADQLENQPIAILGREAWLARGEQRKQARRRPAA